MLRDNSGSTAMLSTCYLRLTYDSWSLKTQFLCLPSCIFLVHYSSNMRLLLKLERLMSLIAPYAEYDNRPCLPAVTSGANDHGHLTIGLSNSGAIPCNSHVL